MAVGSSSLPVSASPALVVLTGNPNCGKTTLFNVLTGLRAKVGNYAGVTVERKEGRLLGSPADLPVTVLDLPGTYSLSPQSLDEQIARDILLRQLPEVGFPGVVVVVVDASNLERNLYYATQVIELGYPTVVGLNMIDVAQENGHELDAELLGRRLGVPVVPLVASRNEGCDELRARVIKELRATEARPVPGLFCELGGAFAQELETLSLAPALNRLAEEVSPRALALLLLTDAKGGLTASRAAAAELNGLVLSARQRIEAAGIDWRSAAIEARYATVTRINSEVVTESAEPGETLSDKLDRVLTHKVWGTLIFVALMGLMFQSIFTFATVPMDALQAVVSWFGAKVGAALPPGDLNSLLVDGIIAGVGSVVVFLPQILLLFLFIGFLEDTGYMARAAFLMDRLMSKVGLHGKSFIPMLSSFACAIPGVMATRTIESPKDRLVTILVAPLMSCSARLPVYTLLIAACIPDIRVLGVFKLQGLTMLAMYLLGTVVALLMAWLFKATLLKGETPMLILELPPYKRPLLRVVARHMWDRSKLFLRRAGTVILGISILLWFLATYPRSEAIGREFAAQRVAAQSVSAEAGKSAKEIEQAKAERLKHIDDAEKGEVLRHSFAGRLGTFIEPAIAPLGFDWKMGIGIIASFAAREVFVTTMSTVYNLGQVEDTAAATPSLAQALREEKRPDGTAVYTPLVAVSLMVFYVFALQCVSTVAVVRRETNSWKWPVFQWLYMGALAWGLAFLTYQAGKLLGLG